MLDCHDSARHGLTARISILAEGAATTRRVAIALALCVATVAGCKTVDYTAANLPAELLAVPQPNTDINLERMVGSSVGTSQIGPDDLVQITIVSGNGEERAAPMPARVAGDGTVMVPLVGSVRVGGLEPVVAEKRIAAAAIERGIYRQPYVTLTVTEPAVNHVTVLGAVEKPGVVKLSRGSCDLASALAAAGGLAKNASTQIEVFHRGSEPFLANDPPNATSDESDSVRLAAYNQLETPGSSIGAQTLSPHNNPAAYAPLSSAGMMRIDLAQAGSAGPQNRKLDDSDVIMVLPKESQVIHVTGLVKRPDQFEVEDNNDIHVLDAIAMAGGTTSVVADKVFVIRQLPTMQEPAVIKLSISRAKRDGNENLLLAAGDLVSVESTPSTMTVDMLSKFVRFAVGGSITAF
jgi:polysaccharide export outer membrane protein